MKKAGHSGGPPSSFVECRILRGASRLFLDAMLDSVFAVALGGVHQVVGRLEHLVHGGGRGVPGDEADAEGDGPAVAARELQV